MERFKVPGSKGLREVIDTIEAELAFRKEWLMENCAPVRLP
jgi:hypothetical protein